MRLLLVGAVAIACGGCGHAEYPRSAAHSLLGQPLPRIRNGTTLDGQSIDSAQFSGKPVLVKFFADYCPPCKVTLPAVERLHEEHPEVIFLGVEEDESTEVARAVVQRFSLTFPVIHDAGNVLSGRFRVSTMPMTFLADATGSIRWVGDETQTEDELRNAIDALR